MSTENTRLVKSTDRVYYLPENKETDQPFLYYIKGDNYSVAIDAGQSKKHVETFYHAIEAEGFPLPSYTLITHWHWDHTFGLPYIHGESIANEMTREKLNEVGEWVWTEEAMDEREKTGEDIIYCNISIKKVFSDLNEIQVISVDKGIHEPMKMDLGGIHLVLYPMDTIHSRDGLLVYLPEEKALFIGDADCEDHYVEHGKMNPARLISYTKFVQGIDFECYYMGHDVSDTHEGVMGYLEEQRIKYGITKDLMIARKSSRLVLLNERNELFLFQYDFSQWGEAFKEWITPGGGAEPDETEEETLRREVKEELGIEINEALPMVYTQNRILTHPTLGAILSIESFYLMQCKEQDFNFVGWTDDEKENTKAYHWWTPEELRATKEQFFTERIYDWYEAVLQRKTGGYCYRQGVKFEEMMMPLADYRYSDYSALEGVSFRYAREEDRNELRNTVAKVEEEWVQYFTGKESVILACVDNQIVGFAILDFDEICSMSREDNQIGTIGCVGVIPQMRNQGIGLSMVAFATNELKMEGCTHATIHYTYLEEWYGKLGYQTYLDYVFCED